MDRVPTRRQSLGARIESPNRGEFPALGMRVLELYEIFEVNEGSFGFVLGMRDLRSGCVVNHTEIGPKRVPNAKNFSDVHLYPASPPTFGRKYCR